MHLHLEPPAETILAVALGAVLATVGGFLATEIDTARRRRDRERSAALLFGELMKALETIIRIADQARRHGDPFGPFTLRMLRAAERETDAYERNRAALYDLSDGRLRLQIHVLMVRMGLSLKGIFEMTTALAELAPDSGGRGARASSRSRREQLDRDRAAAFEFALRSVGEFQPLLRRLEKIGGVSFEDLAPYTGSLYPSADAWPSET